MVHFAIVLDRPVVIDGSPVKVIGPYPSIEAAYADGVAIERKYSVELKGSVEPVACPLLYEVEQAAA